MRIALPRRRVRRRRWLFLLLLAVITALANGPPFSGRQLLAQRPAVNAIGIDLFMREGSPQSDAARKFLADLRQRRPGIVVREIDVTKDKAELTRLWALSKRFGKDQARLPTIYMTDRLWVGFGKTTGQSLVDGLTVHAYIRPTCPHCHAAKAFLNDLRRRWPALAVEYHDVTAGRQALQEANDLARKHQAAAVSFPVILHSGRLQVGFISAGTTGARLEAPLKLPPARPGADAATLIRPAPQTAAGLVWLPLAAGWQLPLQGWLETPPGNLSTPDAQSAADAAPLPEEAPLPDDALLPEEAPLPGEAALPAEALLPAEGALPVDQAVSDGSPGADASQRIDLELFGRQRSFNVTDYGLPAFTLVIGLIDGFNPCAMWVLIFLLSILVNVRDRTKILLIAGVFVLVSGLAYFAFMAAWLNVFYLIGIQRPVQVVLGTLAVVVGIINVKDFFAFHKGVTLSIPESARPGLYRRMRDIVKANYLGAALGGVVVLAVIVNIIELLCTAGLPAMYTQILTMHDLPVWANYAYLGLYILAYMADDCLMIGVALVTLSNRRMQETEGRWLKLLSGVVILLLGLVMLFQPDLLAMT